MRKCISVLTPARVSLFSFRDLQPYLANVKAATQHAAARSTETMFVNNHANFVSVEDTCIAGKEGDGADEASWPPSPPWASIGQPESLI